VVCVCDMQATEINGSTCTGPQHASTVNPR
jgi:hypothetical protein